ncbi:MAG TPA: hypothetical protein ENK45_03695, partial [Aliiroseovarius sp.]|nr:hypothetical protein [Aliiroseovarius sp.]
MKIYCKKSLQIAFVGFLSFGSAAAQAQENCNNSQDYLNLTADKSLPACDREARGLELACKADLPNAEEALEFLQIRKSWARIDPNAFSEVSMGMLEMKQTEPDPRDTFATAELMRLKMSSLEGFPRDHLGFLAVVYAAISYHASKQLAEGQMRDDYSKLYVTALEDLKAFGADLEGREQLLSAIPQCALRCSAPSLPISDMVASAGFWECLENSP